MTDKHFIIKGVCYKGLSIARKSFNERCDEAVFDSLRNMSEIDLYLNPFVRLSVDELHEVTRRVNSGSIRVMIDYDHFVGCLKFKKAPLCGFIGWVTKMQVVDGDMLKFEAKINSEHRQIIELSNKAGMQFTRTNSRGEFRIINVVLHHPDTQPFNDYLFYTVPTARDDDEEMGIIPNCTVSEQE